MTPPLPSDKLQSALETKTSSSPVPELAPLVNDQVLEPKKKTPRAAITQNACTACRRRRKKCDGKSPCTTCSSCGIVRGTTVCVYEANARVAKSELQRENGELRRQNALSGQIFRALRSDRQVSSILQLLKDQEGLALIAKIANSPSIESSINSPSEGKPVVKEGLMEPKHESKDSHSPEKATETAPSEIRYPWITAPCDEQLTKHLFSLYWTWIHPAYLLFSMEQFIEGYKTGNQEHCSAFLVAAVCAAACDLLSPHWTSMSGKIPDIAALRRDFVAKAIRQEVLADRGARTWLEASRVMLIVNSRAEVSCLTRAAEFVQDDGG